MHGQRVDSRTEVEAALTAAQAHHGPSLIEFVVEQHDMVYPMVSPGAALDDMVRRPQSAITLPLPQPAPVKIKS